MPSAVTVRSSTQCEPVAGSSAVQLFSSPDTDRLSLSLSLSLSLFLSLTLPHSHTHSLSLSLTQGWSPLN